MNLPRPVYIAIRIVIPVLILAGGYFGYVTLAGLRKPPSRSRPEAGLPLVRTVPAKQHTGEMTIRLDGTVVPFREITLSSEVAGRVVQKSGAEQEPVRAGLSVRKGQVLIRIDPRDYELEVRRQEQLYAQAVASISETLAEIENSDQQIELLTRDFDRSEADLAKVRNLRGMGAATENDEDNAEQAMRAAKSALTREESNRKLLTAKKSRLESARDLAATEQGKAQLDLDRCTIVSPCDGIIVEDHVELDAFIQRGEKLLTVQDTSAAEVRTSLRMDDIYWLWQHRKSDGSSAESETQGKPRSEWEIPDVPVVVKYELNDAVFRWEGRLSRLEGPGLDEATRTIPCRVIVRNPTAASLENATDTPAVRPPALFRGMFVHVELRTLPSEELIAVPEKAIRPGEVIWMVQNGKLQRLNVRVARVFGGIALLHAAGSGIRNGDAIVVSPISTETSGMPVEVRDEQNSPDVRPQSSAEQRRAKTLRERNAATTTAPQTPAAGASE